MVMHFMEGPGGPKRAGTPIALGVFLLALAIGVVNVLPAFFAAGVLGVLVSAVVCFVILMTMPRATQVSIMGAAIGVSADAGYAEVNDQTPVTVANALVKVADSLTKSIGIITADAHVAITEVTPIFVWSLILATIVFMGLSFLIKHDG